MPGTGADDLTCTHEGNCIDDSGMILALGTADESSCCTMHVHLLLRQGSNDWTQLPGGSCPSGTASTQQCHAKQPNHVLIKRCRILLEKDATCWRDISKEFSMRSFAKNPSQVSPDKGSISCHANLQHMQTFKNTWKALATALPDQNPSARRAHWQWYV